MRTPHVVSIDVTLSVHVARELWLRLAINTLPPNARHVAGRDRVPHRGKLGRAAHLATRGVRVLAGPGGAKAVAGRESAAAGAGGAHTY